MLMVIPIARGNFVDQSDRTGYGMSMTRNGLKTDPENGIVVNLNTAYLDANNEKDFTAGINALWKRFELGYIYAHNKIDEFSGVVLITIAGLMMKEHTTFTPFMRLISSQCDGYGEL